MTVVFFIDWRSIKLRWLKDAFDKGIHQVQDVALTGSQIQQPTDIQSHYQTTIQTHNAVSVGATTFSIPANWTSCKGFDSIEATALYTQALSDNKVNILWSNDGLTVHAEEPIIASGYLNAKKAGGVPTRADYFKIVPYNAHTAADTISVFAYLKA